MAIRKYKIDSIYNNLQKVKASNQENIINAINGIHTLSSELVKQHLSYKRDLKHAKEQAKLDEQKAKTKEKLKEKQEKKALLEKEKKKAKSLERRKKKRKEYAKKYRERHEQECSEIKGRIYFKSLLQSRGYILKRNGATKSKGVESFDIYDLEGRILIKNYKLPIVATLTVRKKAFAQALKILERQEFILKEKTARQRKEIE